MTLFIILAGLAAAGGVLSFFLADPLHIGFSLSGSLLGISGLLFLLNKEAAALLQLAIAISTLFVVCRAVPRAGSSVKTAESRIKRVVQPLLFLLIAALAFTVYKGVYQMDQSAGGMVPNEVPLSVYLVLALLLFCTGLYGSLIKKNAGLILLFVELMLSAAVLNLAAFSEYGSFQAAGGFFTLLFLLIGTAETGAGFALFYTLSRSVRMKTDRQ